MASDDSSGARPAAPIVLRIKLRYEDVEAMVQGFATNVGKSGLFLPTRSLQPLGAEVKFELRLANDTPVLVGLGRVKATTPPDPQQPRATSGMAIELMRVTPQSRALILRMLERRRAVGLPETPLPLAADIDAARRIEASEPAREPAREPVREPASDALLTAPRRTTHPMPTAQPGAIAPLSPEPPRRKRVAVSEIVETASGPVTTVAVTVPGLDDEVDVVAALVRARALTGGEADAELDALAESAAVPEAITIEGASAELARQLGGSAVRRDRTARWAPPPATTAPERAGSDAPAVDPGASATFDAMPAVAAPVERMQDAAPAQDVERMQDAAPAQDVERARDAAPAPAVERAPDPELDPDAAHEHDAAPVTDVMPVIDAALIARVRADATPTTTARAHSEPLRDPPTDTVVQVADTDAAPDSSAERAAVDDPGASGVREAPVIHGVAAAAIADEVHLLDDFDLEDVEHTEMGAIPEAEALEMLRELPVSPDVDQMLLAERLEAELAAAEADDDGDDNELGLAIELAHAPVEPPIDLSLEEIDEFEILAEADVSSEAHPGAAHAHGAPSHDSPPPLDLPELSEGLDHLHDHADDHADHAGPAEPPASASQSDFAARLDLGDDSDANFALPGHDFAPNGDPDVPAPPDVAVRHDSADDHDAFSEPGDDHPDPFAHRRIVQPIFEIEASGSFTLAGIPSDDFELPPRPRSEPEPDAEPDLPPPRRRAQRSPEHHVRPSVPDLASLHDPVDDHELEHALEALDVDLDDLSIPHAATELARDPSRQTTRAPALAPLREPATRPSANALPTGTPRATSHDDDEVIIDFDDD